MDSSFDAALRVQITDILCNLLGVKKPADVLLAEVLPEAILREAQVGAITNLSHATIRRRVAAGSFPPPLKLGDDRQGAASGWLASEVITWMRRHCAARRAAEPARSVKPANSGAELTTLK